MGNLDLKLYGVGPHSTGLQCDLGIASSAVCQLSYLDRSVVPQIKLFIETHQQHRISVARMVWPLGAPTGSDSIVDAFCYPMASPGRLNKRSRASESI
jgi:hypothetical protein